MRRDWIDAIIFAIVTLFGLVVFAFVGLMCIAGLKAAWFLAFGT